MLSIPGANRIHFGERRSAEMHDESDLAPIVAIGGLLTVKQVADWYKPILSKDRASVLPPHKRFLAPPQRGLGKVEEMRKEFTERLENLYDALGRKKLFVVGHSFGGLLATMAAVERPDMVAAIASLGGVHTGYNKKTLANQALKHSVRNPPEGKLLRHDSDFMHDHKHRMKTEWPEGVPLYVISTPLDFFVVPPEGFGVELTHGKSEDRLIVPPVPGAAMAIKFAMGLPSDVEPLYSTFLTEHLLLPRNPDGANFLDHKRRALAEVTPKATGIRNLAELAVAAA